MATATRRNYAEREMQKTIVKWLRSECEEQPPLRFVGSANGTYLGAAGKPGKAGPIRWASLQATGCSPGYPDLFIHRRGADGEIGLAVELKVGANALTPAQRAWRDALVAEGCHYAVVYSVAEFQAVLQRYLHGTPPTVAAQRSGGRSGGRVVSRRGTAELPLVL